MSKEITVKMTLAWTFPKKDWSDEQRHIKDLEEDATQTLGYDTLHAIFMLNDVAYPQATNIRVVNAY